VTSSSLLSLSFFHLPYFSHLADCLLLERAEAMATFDRRYAEEMAIHVGDQSTGSSSSSLSSSSSYPEFSQGATALFFM